jgi:hypothetical protein
MAVGVWSAFNYWKGGSVPLGIAGTVLILTAPAIAVAALLLRNAGSPAAPEVSAPLLIDSIERADQLLRAITLARASIFIAISYAVVLWFCQLSGMIDTLRFVGSYTLVCALAAAGFLPWLNRREKPAQADREACRARLAEFKFARATR